MLFFAMLQSTSSSWKGRFYTFGISVVTLHKGQGNLHSLSDEAVIIIRVTQEGAQTTASTPSFTAAARGHLYIPWI